VLGGEPAERVHHDHRGQDLVGVIILDRRLPVTFANLDGPRVAGADLVRDDVADHGEQPSPYGALAVDQAVGVPPSAHQRFLNHILGRGPVPGQLCGVPEHGPSVFGKQRSDQCFICHLPARSDPR
jgi:hypothetical protein